MGSYRVSTIVQFPSIMGSYRVSAIVPFPSIMGSYRVSTIVPFPSIMGSYRVSAIVLVDFWSYMLGFFCNVLLYKLNVSMVNISYYQALRSLIGMTRSERSC